MITIEDAGFFNTPTVSRIKSLFKYIEGNFTLNIDSSFIGDMEGWDIDLMAGGFVCMSGFIGADLNCCGISVLTGVRINGSFTDKKNVIQAFGKIFEIISIMENKNCITFSSSKEESEGMELLAKVCNYELSGRFLNGNTNHIVSIYSKYLKRSKRVRN